MAFNFTWKEKNKISSTPIKKLYEKIYVIKTVCFIIFLILGTTVFSQTITQTIINYETWTGASGCNIFATSKNVPTTINGASSTIEHLTAIGQPEYDNSNKSVNLASEIVNSSQNQGTEYRITANFKAGSSYKITINAARIMFSQMGPNVLLRLDMNNGGSGNNVSCNGTGIIDANASGNLKQSLPITKSTFDNYVFNYGALSAARPYLMVAAIPPSSSVYQTILIRKITIEESSPTTPPAYSFALASSPTAISCGSTTPVTFTATGSNVPSGATVTYNWNLGANNGWEYNGSTAPSTISTGAANTITLTPACGSTLSNVSATATVNGTATNTNASAVSITQPSYTISGSSSLCSGNANYIINGLVCNSSIAWTAPPANLGSLSTLTASPTTLTYGGTPGNFTLTANVTSCGIAQQVTLPVRVGPNTSSDYTLSGNNGSMYWCPNQTISFSVSGTGASNFNWTLPTGWTMNYNGGNYVSITTPSSPNPTTGTLSVSFNEPCGALLTLNKFLAHNSSACSSGSPYTVTPNPASSYITIACASLQTYCNIAAVQITDLYGNVMSSNSWSYTNQSVQMPVYFLQNGNYIARTYNGTQWYTNQFVVQH